MKLPPSQDELYQDAFRQKLRLGHPNRTIGIVAMLCAAMLAALAFLGQHAAVPPGQMNAGLNQPDSKNSM